MLPSPRIASTPCVGTVHNKHTGGGGGWCLHPITQATWPQLYVCLVFCLLPFPASPFAPVRFLGLAGAVHENPLLRASWGIKPSGAGKERKLILETFTRKVKIALYFSTRPWNSQRAVQFHLKNTAS
jgi:hypothetical protein